MGISENAGIRTLLAHQRDIHAPLQCIPVQPLQLGCPRAIRIDPRRSPWRTGMEKLTRSNSRNEPLRAASPPVKSLSLIHLIPLTISTSKTKPPRALLPLGASEAYRCATRAPEHTAPENGDTFLIEKNGRIEETAGVRGDSHGQAARRTSLFPHSSRTD